jgi:hypothetical protein
MDQLTQEQKDAVIQWVGAGDKPAQVQTKLEETFGLKLTFMDVRFLIDDLDLDLVAAEPPKAPEAAAPAGSPADAQAELVDAATGGEVSVDVDAIQKPGTMLSGTAILPDGQSLSWQVDQLGRLGIVPAQEGYQPSPEALEQFQMALQTTLQNKGML